MRHEEDSEPLICNVFKKVFSKERCFPYNEQQYQLKTKNPYSKGKKCEGRVNLAPSLSSTEERMQKILYRIEFMAAFQSIVCF